ncbi:Hypothetical predicted protein [Olea europaea subsp. europaea]|uniref:Uncharacterized protein n=1 Tax=Olea europaea subsp. europaea TaxID=158383 RepID=A0A8S0PH73_OLEEU|nr:Hypothetical predicted protein [Olea europaea subsp. europaea]
MMHPEHGLHTESLLRLGHVPDMACTSCPQKAYKCLKIRMHPYRGQEASLSWPWEARVHPELSRTPCLQTAYKCLKIRMRSYYGQDASRTWPTHRAQKLPTNDASLPRQGHILDMACTPCPQIAYKCLKIKWRSYRGQASPRSGQHTMPKNFPEMLKDQAASLPLSRSIPFIAYTLSPKNCLEMLEYRAASRMRRGRGLHTMSQK